MKMSQLVVVSLLSAFVLCCTGNALAGKTLFDDFSTGRLDIKKWWPREYVREISGGKLVTKLGNADGMGAEIQTGLFNIPMEFKNPETVHSIQCEVTIVDTVHDSPSSYSAVRVGGYFYNKNSSGGATGDIFAHIKIGDRGDAAGYWAEWTAYEVIDDSGTLNYLDEGILVSPGGIDHSANTVIISYDNDRTISFNVNGNTDTFVGPAKEREAVILGKAIATTISTDNSAEKGFIHAEIDNVYVNGPPALYDDFSSALIDTNKWGNTEWVREVSEGNLRANIIGNGSTRTVNTRLTEKDAPYFEAKVRIDSSSQLSQGAYGVGRIQGYYYNDSRGPGSGQNYRGYEGDVFVQVRLRYSSDGTLSANAYVDRSNDENESSFTNLFSHSFSVPIELDTYYVLSIRFEGKKLIFGCAGETAEYNVTTPIYSPYGEHRLLRSRAYLDPGETGYIKVRFDDVYIEKKGKFVPSFPMLLLDE